MKVKFKYYIYVLGVIFLASCSKDNSDITNIEEEDDQTQVVLCDLQLELVQDTFQTIITALVSGGTEPYFYEWSTGENDASVEVGLSGTYSVTVEDANGCTITQNIDVIGWDPCAGLSLTILPNSNNNVLSAMVTGGSAPYLYEWTTGDTADVIEVTDDGVYSVTVTDVSGCIVVESISVANTGTDCNGFNVTISHDSLSFVLYAVTTGGTAPYFYEWSSGETTESIQANAPGEYTVIVVDALGCTSAHTITVFDSGPCTGFGVETSLDTLGTTLSAFGYGGTPPYSYSWSSGESTSSISVVSGGTYTVEVIESSGCTVVETVFVQ